MPPKILFIDPAGEILGGTLLGILSVDLAGERLIVTGRLGRKNLEPVDISDWGIWKV